MSRGQKITFTILMILICIMSFAFYDAAMDVYQGWAQEPLGPELADFPTSTSYIFPPTWTPIPAPTDQATKTPLPTIIAETPTPVSPLFACNDLPTMILLGIGSDQRGDNYKYGRADVIRAIRVDFRTQRVTVLAFPRDLWVKIPEIKDNIGTNKHKLNTAYYFGNPGLHFWDHPSEGPGLLAQTLERNFGLTADHYLAVSMNVFVDIVDAIGGLDIYLEEEIDGRYAYDQSERLYFPAGQLHLTGEQALTLARNRKGSVFNRMDYQNMVICTLQEKLKNPNVIPLIPEIIAAFQDNLQTDLSPLQITQLACLGIQMPKSNIVFSSFPNGTFWSSRIYDPLAKKELFIWEADFNQMRAYVEQFEAGTWPTISTSSSSGEPESGTSGCE
jgi:LCP family protein required for cell wall assembly